MSKVFRRKGLKNLKNTCFMNSILQLLVGIEDIRDFFINIESSEIPETLLDQFIALLQSYISESHLIIPRDLVETSFKLFIDSKPYTQQDAQEYFYLLIDKLNTELSAKDKPKIFESLFRGEITTIIECELEKKTIKEEFFQLNLSIQDIDNYTKSNRSQEELNLLNDYWESLLCKRFRKYDALTVQDCLRQNFNNLERSVQESCLVCQKSNHCFKKNNISVFPRYLIICLKRFDYKKKFSKLSNKVIASDSLKINQFQYELISIIEHQNYFWKRHYKIFCKDNNAWFECNDSKIKPTTFKKVQKSEPYMLLYKIKPLQENPDSILQPLIPDAEKSESEIDQISLRFSKNRQSSDSNQVSREMSSKRNTINSVAPLIESEQQLSQIKFHTISKSHSLITPYNDIDQHPKYQSLPKPN